MEKRELSFWRTGCDVDLVERALETSDPVVICVARAKSKEYISLKIVEEVSRREFYRKYILFVASEEKVVDKFAESLQMNTNLMVIRNWNFDDFCQHPTASDHHIVYLGTIQYLLNFMSQHSVLFNTVALILLYDTNPLLAYINSLSSKLPLSSHSKETKFVGLNDNVLDYQTSHTELEEYLKLVKEEFKCNLLISNDLVAVNRYGERALEKNIYCPSHIGTDKLSQHIASTLQFTIEFLNDLYDSEVEASCVTFLKYLFKECFQVLVFYGPWVANQTINVIAREIIKFEKRVFGTTEELLLQFCRTQINIIQRLFDSSGTEVNTEATELTKGLFQVLLEQKKSDLPSCASSYINPCTTTQSESLENEHCPLLNPDNYNDNTSFLIKEILPRQKSDDSVNSNSRKLLESSSPSLYLSGNGQIRNVTVNNDSKKENKHFTEQRTTNSVIQEHDSSKLVNSSKHSAKLRRTLADSPFTVIFVKTPVSAQAIYLMINEVSRRIPKFSFLSSKFISGSWLKKKKDSKDIDCSVQNDMMRNIQNGSINVLIATYDLVDDLHFSRCDLLVSVDVPKDYESFIKTKSKLRAANARFVSVIGRAKNKRSEQQYKIYQAIENVLASYCMEYRLPSQLLHPQLVGEHSKLKEFISLDSHLIASIHHINRYCSKFLSGCFGTPVPRCKTIIAKEGDCVRLTSTLYLPRNCMLYNRFEGEIMLKIKATDELISKAKIFSEMIAAHSACQALYEANELDQNLEPFWDLTFPAFTGEEESSDFVVADGGLGQDGSVKRKRAYRRKYPSALTDNIPVADQVCHVYSLEMVLTKPLDHERAVRSYFGNNYKLHLGLVSRKHLPKLPGFLVFDRGGEVTVTPRCQGSMIVDQCHLQLVQRFHVYVFKHILDLGPHAALQFQPETQTSGYYVTLLYDTQCEVKEMNGPLNLNLIAFDVLREIEKSLGSFLEPHNPVFGDCKDYERFRDAVVATVYTKETHRYYVANILYGITPLSEFPDTDVATTFQEYFLNRYGIRVNPEQPLLDVDHVSVRLNFLHPRYQNPKGQVLAFPQENSNRYKKSKVYLIPETCLIFPIPAHLWRQITLLPSALYQLDALLLAEELRLKVSKEVGLGLSDWPDDIPIPMLTGDGNVGEIYPELSRISLEYYRDHNIHNNQCEAMARLGKNDCTVKENIDISKEAKEPCRCQEQCVSLHCCYFGPSSTLLLRAMTPAAAGTMFSYERLETFGDSFSKFSVSVCLFFQHQFENEAKLSFLRGLKISNRQLFYLGCCKEVASYMFIDIFQPLVTWIPSGFTFTLNERNNSGMINRLDKNLSDISSVDYDDDDALEEEEQKVKHGLLDKQSPNLHCTLSYDKTLNPMNCVCTSDKSIADATEALIGAYLITCGELGALQFMKWLGMDVKLPEEMVTLTLANNDQSNMTGVSYSEYLRPNYSQELRAITTEFKSLEAALGYSFNDKHLLLQALTHTSYPRHYNTIKTSYENLEFLGDALLDYMVTRHLYFNHRHLDSHLITDVRSAVVNNYSLAVLAVKLGLHRHLRALSVQLFEVMNKFVKHQNSRHFANPEQVYSSAFTLSVNIDGSDCETIEVPKPLGDLVEAVIGAVYMDSGLKVERVWSVFYPHLKDSIDHYSADPPMSPVRQLVEKNRNAVRFSPPEHMIDGRFKCFVKVFGIKRSFVGIGRNYKIAKTTAAQQALKYLASIGQ